MRDDGRREPRLAHAMHALLGMALNVLRTRSPHRRDDESMVSRAEAIEHRASVAPRELLRRAS